jgi:hypothetical protein
MMILIKVALYLLCQSTSMNACASLIHNTSYPPSTTTFYYLTNNLHKKHPKVLYLISEHPVWQKSIDFSLVE